MFLKENTALQKENTFERKTKKDFKKPFPDSYSDREMSQTLTGRGAISCHDDPYCFRCPKEEERLSKRPKIARPKVQTKDLKFAKKGKL